MTDTVQTRWDADAVLAFLETKRDTLRSMGVRRIGLFGSYARGDQSPDSDLDVLLTVEHWTWSRWCTVWDFLEDELGLKVDLVPERNLRDELRESVLAEVRYVFELPTVRENTES